MAKKRRYFRVDYEVVEGDEKYLVATNKKATEDIVLDEHPEAENILAFEITKEEYKAGV